MNQYRKMITLKGYYYEKDYEKKHDNIKTRYVQEATVRKFFKTGDASVKVVLVEQQKEIVLDRDSDPIPIKKYLGDNFLK